MAPKKDKSNYVCRFKEDQVVIKKPGDLDGADFAISNCKNCEIYIFDHIAQIFVDDSTNCKVYIGPTKGSVFVRDCQDIELHSSSSQLRISDTKNIKAFCFSQSDPTLENTSGLVLAPYSFLFPGLKDHFDAAGLVPSEDKWSQVFDFTPNKESKNWTLMNPSEYTGPFVKEIEGVEGDTTNPVPIARIYGGDSDVQIILGSADDSNKVIDGMASFNIHVSQQQAQEVFQQTEQEVFEQTEQQVQFVEETQQQVQFVEETQQQIPQGQPVANNDNDDFFDMGFSAPTTNQPQQQQHQYEVNFDEMNQFEQQNVYQPSNTFTQGGFQPVEKTEKQKKEEEITRLVIEKQEKEIQLKREKRNAAQAYLQNFKQQRQQQIQLKYKISLEEEQVLQENKQKEEKQVMNPWEKVTKNISLKAGEYPGQQDVSCMKQAILNKKSDTQQ